MLGQHTRRGLLEELLESLEADNTLVCATGQRLVVLAARLAQSSHHHLHVAAWEL